MKPRTKLQKRVASLAPLLPELTFEQKQYAFKNCFDHWGYRSKRHTVCMSCLHSFQTDRKRCKCPSCGFSLEICDTKKQIHRSERYFCIVTTYSGMQVLRFFYTTKRTKIDVGITYKVTEVLQQWITEGGSRVDMALMVGFMGRGWNYDSGLEVRKTANPWCVNPDAIWPRKRFIPTLKRNGFKGNFYNITPIKIIEALLADNKAEILYKSGQIQMFKHLISHGYRNLEAYWPSIMICIRHGYTIEDPSDWIDYVDDLVYLDKDTHNPKYLCPANLSEAHIHFTKKRREIEKRIELEEQKQRIEEAEIEYQKQKKRYFGLKMSDGSLDVVVLDTVKEFAIEGDIHQHCVFANEYYKEKNSLILSARKGEQRIATVEVDLKKYSIVQCRGFQNKQPDEYDLILNIVNKNMSAIRKLKRVKTA